MSISNIYAMRLHYFLINDLTDSRVDAALKRRETGFNNTHARSIIVALDSAFDIPSP